MKLLLGMGLFDFVTTAGNAQGLADALAPGDRVSVRTYTSGHMPHRDVGARRKLPADLLAFIGK